MDVLKIVACMLATQVIERFKIFLAWLRWNGIDIECFMRCYDAGHREEFMDGED